MLECCLDSFGRYQWQVESHTVQPVGHGLDHGDRRIRDVGRGDRLVGMPGDQIGDIAIDSVPGERRLQGVAERVKDLAAVVDAHLAAIAPQKPSVDRIFGPQSANRRWLPLARSFLT